MGLRLEETVMPENLRGLKTIVQGAILKCLISHSQEASIAIQNQLTPKASTKIPMLGHKPKEKNEAATTTAPTQVTADHTMKAQDLDTATLEAKNNTGKTRERPTLRGQLTQIC